MLKSTAVAPQILHNVQLCMSVWGRPIYVFYVFYCLSGLVSRGNRLRRDVQTSLALVTSSSLSSRTPKSIAGQPRCRVPPVFLGSSSGPPPGGTSPKQEAITNRFPSNISWLLSVRRSSSSTPHSSWMTELLTLSRRGAPSHPTEEAHFSCIYPQSCSFSCYPELMTTGV